MGVVLEDGVLHTSLRALNLILTAFHISCHGGIINSDMTARPSILQIIATSINSQTPVVVERIHKTMVHEKSCLCVPM